jgi:hypothetical protein
MPPRAPRVSPVMAASRPFVGDRHAGRQPIVHAHNIGDDLCSPFSHNIGSCSHPLVMARSRSTTMSALTVAIGGQADQH